LPSIKNNLDSNPCATCNVVKNTVDPRIRCPWINPY
jgi:hypothetical protein